MSARNPYFVEKDVEYDLSLKKVAEASIAALKDIKDAGTDVKTLLKNELIEITMELTKDLTPEEEEELKTRQEEVNKLLKKVNDIHRKIRARRK